MAETNNTISMINDLRMRLFTLECEDDFWNDQERISKCTQLYTEIQNMEIKMLIEHLEVEEGEITDVVQGFIDLLNQFQELKSKYGKYSKFDILVKTLYGKRDTSEAPLLLQKVLRECKRMFVKVVEAERATQAIRSRAIELVTEMYEEKVACNDQQELDQDRTDRFLEENEKNIENMVQRILEDNERELFEELFDRYKLEEYILNVLDQYIKLD